MATSTIDSLDFRDQQTTLSRNNFQSNSSSISIEGPNAKLTNALQVVNDALSTSDRHPNQALPIHLNQAASTPENLSIANNFANAPRASSLTRHAPLSLSSDTQNNKLNIQFQDSGAKTILVNHGSRSSSTSLERLPSDSASISLNNPSSSSHFSAIETIRAINAGEIVPSPQATNSTATGKTIVSPDSDVSNGFVKDGKMLPYVFEANEAGVRKRTSKILPVCGVCGKRFVCVTTMKRHLVTHTGEKPFCCKVCGKQYTQKGNLRVHERTHRNDRPFECNICHQKFYRKEPMQKHQWRQHGIVHFKSRPIHSSSASSSSIDQPSLSSSNIDFSSQSNIQFSSPQTNSLIVKQEDNQYPTLSQESPAISVVGKYDGEDEPAVSHVSRAQQPSFSFTYPEPPEAHRSSSSNERNRSVSPAIHPNRECAPQNLHQDQPLQLVQPPQAHNNGLKNKDNIDNSRSISGGETSEVCVNLSSNAMSDRSNSSTVPSLPIVPKPGSSITISPVAPDFKNIKPAVYAQSQVENTIMVTKTSNESNSKNIEINSETANENVAKSENLQTSNEQVILQHAPLKLKMKFAQAYQKEVQEQREKERRRDEEDSRQLGGTCSGVQQIIIKGIDKMELEDGGLSTSLSSGITANNDHINTTTIVNKVIETTLQPQQPKEMVECQCKSCGSTFEVHDPYNFRCDNCNVKYTSMPTHLIADPLQCIGCCQVFPHKPALKAHQMSPPISTQDGGMNNPPATDSKERPFRCCKCGYGFRQKAHLQKHQWRIHRRRIEPMDQQPIKEAEAFFHAIKSSKALSVKPSVSHQDPTSSNDPNVTTVTIQDIINHGVEHSVRVTRPFPGRNTTSSKYYSDVLGLEFDNSNSNSNMSSALEETENEEMEDENRESNMDESLNAKRPDIKEKQSDINQQPLDLSPMKKGIAIDYSNKSRIIQNDAPSQSSTTSCPPKITLRLRDFASTDNSSDSQNFNIVRVSPTIQDNQSEARSRINTNQNISYIPSNQDNNREDNPLLNQRPLPTTHVSFIHESQSPNNNVSSVPSISGMAPAWKKARTTSPSRLANSEHSQATTESNNRMPISIIRSTNLEMSKNINEDVNVSRHRTLPPIGNLQKPMSLVRKLLPTATSLSISNSPVNNVTKGSNLSITRCQANVTGNGSLNLQVRNDNFDEPQTRNIPAVSITQNQTNNASAPFPNINSKSGNSEYVRDKLFVSQDVRTV